MEVSEKREEELTMNELAEKLNTLDLMICQLKENLYAVKRKDIANPLLHFNTLNKGEQYNGSVGVKSINIDLYTSVQIAGALRAVNTFLSQK